MARNRTLILTFTETIEYKVVLGTERGAVSRAIVETIRAMEGRPNVNPDSIQFHVEEEPDQ